MDKNDTRKTIHVNAGSSPYDIIIERGCLDKAGDLLELDRKVLIVTDSGVPSEYSAAISSVSGEAFIETIEPGEDSKSIASFERILKRMLKEAGCPSKPSDIGLGMEQYIHGIRTAQIEVRESLLEKIRLAWTMVGRVAKKILLHVVCR